MKKRSSIVSICFVFLLVIVITGVNLDARSKKNARDKGKAEDSGSCGEYDSAEAGTGRDITSTKTYTVRKGDTVYSIARMFKTSPDVIVDTNNIKNSRILVGMKLKIPVRSADRKKTAAKPDEKKKNNNKKPDGPDFQWPLKKISNIKKDGDVSVKSIGIIITGSPNAEVFASAGGVVKRVGFMRGYGKYIVVVHKNRYVTVYSNMELVSVREGEPVNTGRKLGSISSDCILHFQIGRRGKAEDPLVYLPRRS